ncbi:Hypothetical protein HVR_LOCUS209 [uncultured virus]|nr:Hypothetical protein HVR_LOCUS209 [uncultured virus]
MGNNKSTPATDANLSFDSFTKWSPSVRSLKENKEESKKKLLLKRIEENNPNEFAVYLEDLLINDSQFKGFDDEYATKFLGCLLFKNLTLNLMFKNLAVIATLWSFDQICSAFGEDNDPSETVRELIGKDFAWDGKQFMTWKSPIWVLCDESDVRANPESSFDFDMKIHTFGVNHPSVERGAQWLREKLVAFKEAALKVNDDLETLHDEIKSQTTSFNSNNILVPCASVTVDLSEGASQVPLRNDCFTVRLSCDPTKETTDNVKKFTSSFNCSEKELASHVIRCGARVEPTVTFVSGIGNDGKTTLSKALQVLYGPFACSFVDHEAGKIDYKIARTCFYDEVPSEETIRNHPCNHLVINTQDRKMVKTLSKNYAGRKLHHLKLTTISEESRDTDVLNKISGDSGSLLGWALQNYDAEEFGSNSGELNYGSLLRLMSGGKASTRSSKEKKDSDDDDEDDDDCGDPDCNNCGHKEDKVKKDSEEKESSEVTKVFRIGASGPTEVTQ